MIDEVDSASNNQVVIDFLAQLYSYYSNREKMPIFHSVILAGVYSIKNLKLKLHPESEHQYNSPWNIVADFDIDMSFSSSEYNERDEEQVFDYLDYYHKDKGYMLSLNFNKNKEIGVNEIKIGNKTIVDAVV